jgi:hypothetical protein
MYPLHSNKFALTLGSTLLLALWMGLPQSARAWQTWNLKVGAESHSQARQASYRHIFGAGANTSNAAPTNRTTSRSANRAAVLFRKFRSGAVC